MSFVVSETGSRLERVAAQVDQLFARLDADTAALRSATGLSCPPGCGACCENPHLETTVAELLPIAFELDARGEAEAVLEKPAVQEGSGRCVFFEPDGPGRGRCSIYAHRPSVCRLFGFGAVRTRRGRELALCRVHREADAETAQAAAAHVSDGGRAGDFSLVGPVVSGIDPALGTRPMPLNEALREALSRVLFERSLRETEAAFVPACPSEDISCRS